VRPATNSAGTQKAPSGLAASSSHRDTVPKPSPRPLGVLGIAFGKCLPAEGYGSPYDGDALSVGAKLQFGARVCLAADVHNLFDRVVVEPLAQQRGKGRRRDRAGLSVPCEPAVRSGAARAIEFLRRER